MSDIQDNISSVHLPNMTDKILNELQAGLDINDSPFSDLACKLGIDSQDLYNFIEKLTDQGIIREISPVFNARRLGYTSTLVAVSVSEVVVPDFVKRINTFPGVSHNYARAHKYNTWFTLTVPDSVAGADPFEPILACLQDEFDINEIMSLPSQKMYKLKVQFGVDSASGKPSQPGSEQVSLNLKSEPLYFSAEQRQLIRELQNGIPVVERPYEVIANAVNSVLGNDFFDSNMVVEQLNIWNKQGVIRRIAGRVRHKKVGYQSNAMVVFKVDCGKIDDAGQDLAAKPFVSHCYHRSTNDSWQFNLYAMTHARSESELDAAINDMVALIKPEQYEILNTVKEYKKEAVKYFV